MTICPRSIACFEDILHCAPALHYLSPRFHPWQHDNRDLLRMWLERNDDAYRAIASTRS